MEDFIHLHVHTQYSILDGQAAIPKLVDKAIKNGMRGMAVTDHGNMFGIKELFNYCNKVNKGKSDEEKFKPIFGCEVYCARRDLHSKENNALDKSGWHLILLAKNEVGYHNLIKIVSEAWVDGYYHRPRTDHKSIEKHHEGIIASSACLAGEIPRYIKNGQIDEAEKSIEWFKSVFGDDFYIELMRHEVKDPMQRANRDTFKEQKAIEPTLIELARKHNVKIICTNDSHFVDEDNAEAHDRLLCLSTGKDLDDPNRMLYSKQPGWLKTAGYCIGDDGITVMLLVDYNFAKDTVLEYEWTSNDTNRLESGEIAVAEDGQSEFEFTIKGAEIKADAPLIFRLWEQGHKHVVAYVKLSQT